VSLHDRIVNAWATDIADELRAVVEGGQKPVSIQLVGDDDDLVFLQDLMIDDGTGDETEALLDLPEVGDVPLFAHRDDYEESDFFMKLATAFAGGELDEADAMGEIQDFMACYARTIMIDALERAAELAGLGPPLDVSLVWTDDDPIDMAQVVEAFDEFLEETALVETAHERLRALFA